MMRVLKEFRGGKEEFYLVEQGENIVKKSPLMAVRAPTLDEFIGRVNEFRNNIEEALRLPILVHKIIEDEKSGIRGAG